MVTVVENRQGDMSLNRRQECLHFTLQLYPQELYESSYSSSSNRQTGQYNLGLATGLQEGNH